MKPNQTNKFKKKYNSDLCYSIGTPEEEDSDDEKSYAMNRPTLLRQLQTILSEYPDSAQILRVSLYEYIIQTFLSLSGLTNAKYTFNSS